MTFKPYQHVERIDSVDCEGILNNKKCYIQAKIDGTNSCIWFENGTVHCGSRSREINLNKDNAGFCDWVWNCDDVEPTMIRLFVVANPNLRLFGEWLGSTKFIGHIKDYNVESKSHLYIFDVFDDDRQAYLSPDEYMPMLAVYDLDKWVVETLAVIDYPTVNQIAEIAQNNTFLLDNANHPGEGIVVKCYEWRNQFGRQQFGKLVLDEYKQAKKTSKKVTLYPGEIERTIVDKYCTDAEFAKTIEKVIVACGSDKFDNRNKKHVSMYVNLCWNDLCQCCADWCKKFKNPVVDFSQLKGNCQNKAREYIGL